MVWLEDYLSKWTKLLFMVCHSQDFLNNVCTHIVHLDHHFRALNYYRGNYDSFVDARRDASVEQMKRYTAEQEDIKNMKECVAVAGAKCFTRLPRLPPVRFTGSYLLL